jgi:Calcineurin-like phosphoesterase
VLLGLFEISFLPQVVLISNAMFGSGEGSLDALIHRPEPSWLQLLFATPSKTLAKTLCAWRSPSQPVELADAPIVVVCIADTHNKFPDVPGGDLLVHAGDLSQGGTRREIQSTLDWLRDLPHRHKVVIAGNHELLLDPEKGFPDSERSSLDWHDLIYLQDSSISLRFTGGRVLSIYGSPWTRKHGNWAFEYAPGVDKWTNTVPDDTDLLMTHMPPFAHLDLDGFGDKFLLRESRRVRPRLHVFGHFHAGYGKDELHYDSFDTIYEAVMMRQTGFWGVFKMGCWLVWASLTGKNQSQDHTFLVNAATMGGPRDTDIRAPLTVRI